MLKPGKRYVQIDGEDIEMETLSEEELEKIRQEFVNLSLIHI